MNFDQAREAVLTLLRQQGRAKNSEMQAILGGDAQLFHQVREDLLFNDLAQDKQGAGLIYIGWSARFALLGGECRAAPVQYLAFLQIVQPSRR